MSDKNYSVGGFMKCQSCGSEWIVKTANSVINSCPFCGSLLKSENKNEECNISAAISQTITTFGSDIVLQKAKFLSIIGDLAPMLKKERKILSVAMDENIGELFLNCSIEERDTHIITSKRRLEGILSESAVELVVSSFAEAFGWSYIAEDFTDKRSFENNGRKDNKRNPPNGIDSVQKVDRQLETNYIDAVSLHERKEYKKAMELFRLLGTYKDSSDRFSDCAIQLEKQEMLEKKLEEEYLQAETLFKEGKYIEAFLKYGKLGDYKNSVIKSRIAYYRTGNAQLFFVFSLDYSNYGILVLSDGCIHVNHNTENALIRFYDGKLSGVKNERNLNIQGNIINKDKWNNIISVAGTLSHFEAHDNKPEEFAGDIVALCCDGRVVSICPNTDYETWNNVVSISGNYYPVGLKNDGTCVYEKETYLGKNMGSQLDQWKNISYINYNGFDCLGVTTFGKIVKASGDSFEFGKVDRNKVISTWTDLISTSLGGFNVIFGLTKYGNVLLVGNNKGTVGESFFKNIPYWNSIIQIASGQKHCLGLKYDGTVVAAGINEYGECDVTSWRDIVHIEVQDDISFGVRKDGKILVAGRGCSTSLTLSATDVLSLNWLFYKRIINMGKAQQERCSRSDNSEEKTRRSFLGSFVRKCQYTSKIIIVDKLVIDNAKTELKLIDEKIQRIWNEK